MYEDLIYYNSHDEYYKNPFGAVECNKSVEIRIRLKGIMIPESVFLRLWHDEGWEEKIKMKPLGPNGEYCMYEGKFNTPEEPGLIWYYFVICFHDKTLYYGNNTGKSGGIGRILNHPPDSYQLTVYKQDLNPPLWFSESIMYQIFVDRFCNGRDDGKVLNPREGFILREKWDDTPEYIRDENGAVIKYDFFGGNLLGIIKKLDYLKELNVSVIYLNPIFESSSNHKYDTADYKNIDRMYGDDDAFKLLCSKAGELGIKILLDGVFSHTGSDSIYFNSLGNYPGAGAYQSKDSPFYSWYNFINHPKEYESWWGIGTMPNVNEMNKSYMNFVIFDEDSVIKKWMRLGAKGWRLDVADELPDEFIKNIRSEMKKFDVQSILIGEVWEDASNKCSYESRRKYLLGEELDSIMNYPFREIMLDFMLGRKSSIEAAEGLTHLYENYPKSSFYFNMNLIGSHDVPRILTLLGEAPDENQMSTEYKGAFRLSKDKREISIKRLRLISLIQMTFPGIPCIYYGDEAGVEGFKDPYNRSTYPWGRENMELLDWYRLITALRNKYDVLKTGNWRTLTPNEEVFGYIRYIECRDVFGRERDSNKAVVLINRSLNTLFRVNLYIGGNEKYRMYDILNEYKVYEIRDGRLALEIEPMGSHLLLENA